VTELPEDLLRPEDEPEPAEDAERDDDDHGLSAEESLGMLPSD
jgi:hypothetical protein